MLGFEENREINAGNGGNTRRPINIVYNQEPTSSDISLDHINDSKKHNLSEGIRDIESTKIMKYP